MTIIVKRIGGFVSRAQQFLNLRAQRAAQIAQHMKTFGDSAGVSHKRMWKTNHGVNLSPQDPRTGASGLCVQAAQNYLTRNSQYPYSAQDNPNGRPFEPLDGTYIWSNPNANPDNPCSAVRYIEGPQTRAWITQRDNNYVARIAQEEAKQTISLTEFMAPFFAALQKKAEREQQAAIASEQARIAAEVEAQRQAAILEEQAEAARQAAIQLAAQQEAARIAEMQRQAELQRQVAEAELQRQAILAAERARIAAEAERQRQAAIAAEQEAVRIAAEQAQKNKDQRLFEAIKAGDVEAAQEAVRQGANIFATDSTYSDFQPVAIAAQCGKLAVLQYLFSQGADARVINRFSMTPRGIANALKDLPEHPDVKYVAQFFDAKDQELFAAVKAGNPDGIINAVRQGANLEAIDEHYAPHQYRPVHWAAHFRSVDLFNLLVSLGANPVSLNNNYHSPYAIAAILHPEIASSFPTNPLTIEREQEAIVAARAAIAAQQEEARVAEIQRQAAEAERQRHVTLAAEQETARLVAEQARIAAKAERQRQAAEQAAREQADRAILDAVRVRPIAQRLFSRTNSDNTFTRSQSNPVTIAHAF